MAEKKTTAKAEETKATKKTWLLFLYRIEKSADIQPSALKAIDNHLKSPKNRSHIPLILDLKSVICNFI